MAWAVLAHQTPVPVPVTDASCTLETTVGGPCSDIGVTGIDAGYKVVVPSSSRRCGDALPPSIVHNGIRWCSSEHRYGSI